MSTIEQLQQQIDAMRVQFESKLNELQRSISKNLTSRRGAEGARGEKGDPGVSNIPGPQGVPGRDANVSECVAVAKVAFEQEIAALHARLDSVVLQKLKDAGVVDESGKAILVVGPAGREGVNGQNSTVPGPAGKDGASITGPAGQNGSDAQVAIGSVSAGDEAGASIRVEDGVSYLDLVLPRGEQGERGSDGAASTVAGPAGTDGAGITESDVSYMGVKFRNQWKSDMQIALRTHFAESHNQ